MKILLCRTKNSNERSSAKLETMGFESVSIAMSEVVDTGAEIVASPIHGYIVTSSNAAKILGSRKDPIKGPFYVVGERTKTALQECGLNDVRFVARNARQLGDFIATEYQLRKFVYVAGVQRAFDFDNYFKNFELSVDIVEVYQMNRVDPGKEIFEAALQQSEGGIQLHYSVLSALRFFELVAKYDLSALSRTMHAVAISKKTALNIDNTLVKTVNHAKIETEDEMIKTLESFR